MRPNAVRIVLLAAVGCLLAVLAGAAETPARDPKRKVALVIGNARYPGQPLPNAIKDAREMKVTLEDFRFEVVYLENGNRTEMAAEIGKFARKLDRADIGFVYYAGHGIQIDGINYLVPIDTDMRTIEQIKFNTVRLDVLLEMLNESGVPIRIIVLDACRNNPYGVTRPGLATVFTDSRRQTLIAYATQPGNVAQDGAPGGHGIYTHELLGEMRAYPDRPIEEHFKQTRRRVTEITAQNEPPQVPWESTSLIDTVTLKGGRSPGKVEAARGDEKIERPAPRPGMTFRDCPRCPEMVFVPAGQFPMGSPATEHERSPGEGLPRAVTIPRPFAVGRYEVTFDEWQACLLDGDCTRWPHDKGWGRGRRPVIDVSWEDAEQYVTWLRKKTGYSYRLPSEAEWEYVARAGSTTARPWGDRLGTGNARCKDCGGVAVGTVPVDTTYRNPWTVHGMLGNVWEWTSDCYRARNDDAGTDNALLKAGDCRRRMIRGGSWLTAAHGVRSAARAPFPAQRRDIHVGFRVATSIDPLKPPAARREGGKP
jgi:formylglycine-generating enzyme required for sulfatase activity